MAARICTRAAAARRSAPVVPRGPRVQEGPPRHASLRAVRCCACVLARRPAGQPGWPASRPAGRPHSCMRCRAPRVTSGPAFLRAGPACWLGARRADWRVALPTHLCPRPRLRSCSQLGGLQADQEVHQHVQDAPCGTSNSRRPPALTWRAPRCSSVVRGVGLRAVMPGHAAYGHLDLLLAAFAVLCTRCLLRVASVRGSGVQCPHHTLAVPVAVRLEVVNGGGRQRRRCLAGVRLGWNGPRTAQG